MARASARAGARTGSRWVSACAAAALACAGLWTASGRADARTPFEAPIPTYRSLDENNVNARLPRKIHTLTLAEDSPFPLNLTTTLNPTWSVERYDVSRGRSYMHAHCGRHAKSYETLGPTAFKADLLRYCILYTEGGVWIDDDILLVTPLDELVANMRHTLLLVYDRQVYKLAGGPKQIWNAFMVALPGSEVFARAMDKISVNVANRAVFYHSLYYTGPALLCESVSANDSIEFRWRMQHREGLTAKSRRIADVKTNEEVMLHFKLPRATTHYSLLSRAKDIYE